MSAILKRILDVKKEEISEAKKFRSTISLRDEVEGSLEIRQDIRNFEKALQMAIREKKAGVIAEIKKASPSKGIIRSPFFPDRIAKSYEKHGAACLSVLTDKVFFQGDLSYLKQARQSCGLPVLRKDFMIDFYQIYEARWWRADCILLIVGALDWGLLAELESCALELGMNVLLEVHHIRELEVALSLKSPLLGINNRNLQTFETAIQHTLDLLPYVPPEKRVITESGILTREDVVRLQDAGVMAFLVGEALMREKDPGQALARLFDIRPQR